MRSPSKGHSYFFWQLLFIKGKDIYMKELRTPREINAAVRKNEQGHGGYVFALIMGISMNYEARIYRARTVKGSLYVRRLDTGQWFAPLKVWQA